MSQHRTGPAAELLDHRPRGASALLGLGQEHRAPEAAPAQSASTPAPEASNSNVAAEAPPDCVLLRFPWKPGREGGAPEELRYVVRHYEGRGFIDVRVWYQTGKDWRPTAKGVTVRAKELRAVACVLADAADELDPTERRTR